MSLHLFPLLFLISSLCFVHLVFWLLCDGRYFVLGFLYVLGQELFVFHYLHQLCWWFLWNLLPLRFSLLSLAFCWWFLNLSLLVSSFVFLSPYLSILGFLYSFYFYFLLGSAQSKSSTRMARETFNSIWRLIIAVTFFIKWTCFSLFQFLYGPL